MKLTFLGTGAAEGVPALYCRCRECIQARQNGGKDIRTRSALRIGETHQIDLPPETFYQMIKTNLDMYSIEHLLVTHSHLDHFQFEFLFEKVMSKENNGKPVNLYLSVEAWNFLKELLKPFEKKQSDKRIRTLWDWVKINPVKAYTNFRAGEIQVKTIEGNHTAWGENEKSLNYLLILPNGKKLLYALDTGFYTDRTWEFLAGEGIDVLIMECTFGGRKDRDDFPESHLDINSFIKMLQRMEKEGIINQDTEIYATHINPHHGLLHHEIQKAFNELTTYRITVAYDGLVFHI